MATQKVLRWITTATFIVASLVSARAAHAQGAVVTGKVTTSQGREIEGANVTIPELNISVGTNGAGIYTITLPAARLSGGSAVMRVRSIGYVPQTRTVSLTAGSQSANFSLTQDINRLQAVVTTGVTGATETTKLPFSVAKIDTSDFRVPSANPLSQLAGKVPGATIVSTSGRPGASPAVLLRGPTSISGSGRGQAPLYLVDGIILAEQGSQTGGGGLPDINPLDIESVEVVKGAAASSLYGARAGNGVISIRTKSGLGSSEGVHFTARSEYGTSDIAHKLDINTSHALELDETGTRFCIGPQSGVGRFQCARAINYAQEAFRINDQSTQFVLNPVGSFPVDPGSGVGGTDLILRDAFLVREWPGQNYDAVSQFARPQPMLNNSVDMRGRYGKTAFFASGSALNQGGTIKFLNGFQRTTGRLNIDQQIGTRWSAALTTYYSRANKDGYAEEDGGSSFFRLTRTNPIQNLSAVDSKGRLFVRTNLQTGGTQNFNPLYLLQNRHDNSKTNHFIGGATLRYAPFSWMDLDGNLSYDGAQTNADTFIDKGFRLNDSFTTNAGSDASGLLKVAEQRQSYNAGTNMNLRYDLMSDFHTRTSFRYTFQREDNDFRRGAAGLLTVQGVPSLTNGTTQLDPLSGATNNSTNSSVRSIGFFVAENFDIKDRYIVDALLRRDGSSLFGRANRWKTFGRGSLAWRVSQEPWWFISPIDELKLRASVGTAGGRPGFNYQYQTYNISNGLVSAATLGNNFLKPESIRENEYGLDMQAFHRIGLTLNYSKSVSRDQILNVPLSVATGFGSQWQNAGVLENKSYEASLNVPFLTGRDLQYSTRLIYDRNRSYVTHLYVPSFTPGASFVTNAGNIFLVCSSTLGEAGSCNPAKGESSQRFGTFFGRRFARSCAELPSTVAASCGTPNGAFQKNQDGWIVWVGEGNTVGDGITKNLWNAKLPTSSPFYATTSTGVNGLINPGVAVNWGMPIILRDSTGAAQNAPLGNPLPNYRWGFSQTFGFKRLSAYALLDAARGQHVYNQGRGWSYLDFLEGTENSRGKSVEDAKPLGYYYRGAAPDQSRLGGLYDVLGANNAVTEDASYTKLREVNVGYHVGRIGTLGGDWNLSVIGRNLKTWTKYHGFDPEVGSGAVSGSGSTANGPGSSAITAIDAFTFPNLRSFTFALSTSF
ncbi:MAG: TonB-dependent receptor [Gemmatimonadaceae bacterium]|nr:TonB-dependent receptor [Gemmatimonadaceae bacterium]